MKSSSKKIIELAEFSSKASEKSPQIIAFPTSTYPKWWSPLLLVEKGSTIAAIVMIVGALATYAITVPGPKIWTEYYNRLKYLQRSERDLITTHETIKHDLVEESLKPSSGLIPSKPYSSIYIKANPQTSSDSPSTPVEESPFTHNKPIAY